MAIETRTKVPLRWRDLDNLGHLNQAVYHELLEEGRGALFASLEEDDFPFVLVRVELDYRHEVRRADDYVDIVTRVIAIGRSSVTLEQQILLPDGTVAAEGRAVLVAWDTEIRGPRELSEVERAALAGSS